MKIEQQFTIGFPEMNSVLFLISQSLIPESEIEKPALLKAIKNMTDAQLAYKGLDRDKESLLTYLAEAQH